MLAAKRSQGPFSQGFNGPDSQVPQSIAIGIVVFDRTDVVGALRYSLPICLPELGKPVPSKMRLTPQLRIGRHQCVGFFFAPLLAFTLVRCHVNHRRVQRTISRRQQPRPIYLLLVGRQVLQPALFDAAGRLVALVKH